MKHKTLLLLAACAPALWAFAVPGDRLAFGLGSGSRLTKTFVSESDMTVEDMTAVMNGEEMDMSMLGGFDMSFSNLQRVVVTDEYRSVDGNRPTTVARTYEELVSEMNMEASGPMMQGPTDMSATSELESETVVFALEEGDYVATFAEGSEGDDELLTDLFGEMDLRDFLPDSEVEAGATWEIDTKHVIHLLAPGGNLKIMPEEISEMSMQMPGAANPFDTFGEFDGTVTAEYVGSREVDGKKVGVVKLTVDVGTAKDLTDLVVEMMEDFEMPEGAPDMEMDYDSVDIEFEFSGAGELLWDLASGHVHALDVSGDMLMAMDMAYSMSMQGMDMEMEMEMSMEMSGTQSLTVTVGASE